MTDFILIIVLYSGLIILTTDCTDLDSYSLTNATHIRWLLFNAGGPWAANEADCMANCVTSFHKEFEENTNTTTGLQASYDDPHQFFSQFEPKHLNELCHLYNKSISCTHSCPEEETHDWMRKVFAILEYICKEKFYEFQKNLYCIKSVTKEILDNCSPQCKEQGPVRSFHDTHAWWQTEPDELKEQLRSSCVHISCFMACQRPTLFSLCTEEASNLVDGAMTKAFTNTLNALPHPNISSILPAECKIFAEFTKKLNKADHQRSCSSNYVYASKLFVGVIVIVCARFLMM